MTGSMLSVPQFRARAGTIVWVMTVPGRVVEPSVAGVPTFSDGAWSVDPL